MKLGATFRKRCVLHFKRSKLLIYCCFSEESKNKGNMSKKVTLAEQLVTVNAFLVEINYF